MPQPNNSSPYPNQPPFGGGYPNQGMYPPQGQVPYPSNPGYPSQSQSGFAAHNQQPYPNNAPYPPQSSIPFGAGFPPIPNQANAYPPMQPQANAYQPMPPTQSGSMYPPPSQQCYPPSQPGFQSNYPPTQSTSMPNYPPAQSNYPAPSSTNNVYPSITQHPPSSNQTSFAPQGYPSLQNSGFQPPSAHISATNMAACFSEMQSHRRETKSKVCLSEIYLGQWNFVCQIQGNSYNQRSYNIQKKILPV